jgi:hypothetical protein
MNLDAFPASFIEKNFSHLSMSSPGARPNSPAGADGPPGNGSLRQALPDEVVFQFSLTIKQTVRGFSVGCCEISDPGISAPESA